MTVFPLASKLLLKIIFLIRNVQMTLGHRNSEENISERFHTVLRAASLANESRNFVPNFSASLKLRNDRGKISLPLKKTLNWP